MLLAICIVYYLEYPSTFDDIIIIPLLCTTVHALVGYTLFIFKMRGIFQSQYVQHPSKIFVQSVILICDRRKNAEAEPLCWKFKVRMVEAQLGFVRFSLYVAHPATKSNAWQITFTPTNAHHSHCFQPVSKKSFCIPVQPIFIRFI